MNPPIWFRAPLAAIPGLFAFACGAAPAHDSPMADLVITNALVRTMDPQRPRAEALAVLGNRIAAVGDSRQIAPLADANTRVIDARGRLVLPGFNDALLHFLSGGFQLANVDLRDAATQEEFAARIGPQRARGTYAFRSLLDSGATLAFGSDWTVAPLDPIQGIAAGVTRRTLDGKHPDGWVPEQKITVEEAVRAYTMGSARAEFTDAVKGSLTPGKLAELVMLNDDFFSIPPTDIEKARVLLTAMDGRIIFEANGLKQ